MSKVGLVIGGKYEILKEIGQGGMSIVYVAMDIRLNKQWAVKELKNDGTQSVEMLLKGIEREANILKKVDHPVLPRIVDIIDEQGIIYVIMDYIQGLAMDLILKEEGAQPQERVIEWAKELASALDYLHSMNPPIIYRDMKPSNIMLQPDGRVKLIDFGTAKEYKVENIADTTALGTRGYAAPEQFGDDKGRGIYKTDARTDIYCLGVTMYHIVTGMNPSEPPYEIKPIREWNPALSSGLENIILKCTQPSPGDRYQSCSELIYALEHYDELDNGYHKRQVRKLFFWGLSIVGVIIGISIGMMGYHGMQSAKQQDYRTLIEEANTYKINGDYSEASKIYVQAITDVDGKSSEAYLDLLNLYVNYIDTKQGLDRIVGYIDSHYQNVQDNCDVVKEVALVYLDKLQDYKSSLKYFQMIDEKQVPVAIYYKQILASLTELGTISADSKNEALLEAMKSFEQYNDSLSMSESKMLNYKILGGIYVTYPDNIVGASDEAIKIGEKALEEVGELKDEQEVSYTIDFSTILYKAYRQKGTNASSSEDKASNYKTAINYCDDILAILSDKESAEKRSGIICNIAEMYKDLGDNASSEKEYQQAIKEFGTKYKDVYIGYLSLLFSEAAAKDSNIENWDSTTIFQVYDQGNQVSGIQNDIRWKKITQKLSPLFEKYGRKQ